MGGNKTVLGRSWVKLFDFSRGKRMLLLLQFQLEPKFFARLSAGVLPNSLICGIDRKTSPHKHEENSDPSYHTVHEQNPAVNCQYIR